MDSHERKKFTGPGLLFACLSDQIPVMLPSTLLWKLVDSFMPDFCCQFLQYIAVRPDGLGDCLELNKYWIKKNTGRLPLWAFCFGGYRTCCWWGEGLPWPVVAQLHVRWILRGLQRTHLTAWLLARSLPSAIQQEERGTHACVMCVDTR